MAGRYGADGADGGGDCQRWRQYPDTNFDCFSPAWSAVTIVGFASSYVARWPGWG